MKWIAVSLLLTCPAFAEDVTTAEVGDAAAYLVQKATCAEVIAATQKAMNPQLDTDEILMNLNLMSFIYGYAFAKGQTFDEAIEETLTRCINDPLQPFAGFPKYFSK